MIRISPPEYRILKYVSQSQTELTRPALAKEAGVGEARVSALLRDLRSRDLIEVIHGAGRKYFAITSKIDPNASDVWVAYPCVEKALQS